ncbi:MAG: AEC family transporter [Thermoproteota archaeon]
MLGPLEVILEIIVLLSAGIVLKMIHILNEKIGRKLISISLNLLLPVIVFRSFATVSISQEDSILPLMGLMINLFLLGVAYLASKGLNMVDASRGAFLLGCSTLNIGIVGLPFIELFFDAKGVAIASLLDIGNSLYVFSIAFLVASRFNPLKRTKSLKSNVKGFLTQPYLISTFIGLIANPLGIELPVMVEAFMEGISFINIVLMLIAVGTFIRLPKKGLIHEILLSAIVKIPIGGLIGLTFANLLRLTPQVTKVMMIVASLPPAFMTLIHASAENLDMELATILLGSMLVMGIPIITLYGLLLLSG